MGHVHDWITGILGSRSGAKPLSKGDNVFIRRTMGTLGAAVAALVLAAGPAAAGSPHFIGNLTKASLSGFDLVVKFKEAGLESGSTETVVASAHLDATYQCINNGNHNPDDPKKTTISAEVSESGEFTAGRNGTISGSLTLEAPDADTVLDCPNGQQATLTAVSWSSVEIDDLDSGAHLDIPGTFSAGTPVD